MDIGIDIVYMLMKKQLLEETVPGKTLGFRSLSKMFCIVAIAAAVALSSESTGPLAPPVAQAQTSGDCGCTLQWVNPQDYGDDICGYQLTKDINAALYEYCLVQCRIERKYRDKMAAADRAEALLDRLNLPEDQDSLWGEFIDAYREKAKKERDDGLYEAYLEIGRRLGRAYQRNQECLDWED